MKTEVETKRNPEKKVLNVKDCDGDQDGDEYGGAVGDEGGKLEVEGGKEGIKNKKKQDEEGDKDRTEGEEKWG